MEFKQRLSKYQRDVNELLLEYMPVKMYPEVIYESAAYSLMAKSKRIRPILLLQGALCAGGKKEDVTHLMAAIEMIHTYSLIHDDLPAMDDDELRRGVPTNHVVYGEAIAILAGDALLNLAFETMLRGAKKASDKASYIEAMNVIADSCGINGMIGGQVADIISEGVEPSEETLGYIDSHKTGAILKAACISGAIAVGANEKIVDALSTYGDKIGLMFQIVDDILDVVGDSKELGKNVGVDKDKNKMTYPHVYGMAASHEKVETLYEEALQSLVQFDEKADFLRELAKYLVERKN